jgi:predicted ester cyclase
MSEQNVAVVRRWFNEVWNSRREDLIPELLSSESIAHGLQDVNGNIPKGHEGFKSLFYAFSTAFPDLKLIVEDVVSERDMVVARCIVQGTHRGEGLGVDPTLRPVRFAGLCMMRVEEGKITEIWNQFDFMNMYQQLGVLSLTLG